MAKRPTRRTDNSDRSASPKGGGDEKRTGKLGPRPTTGQGGAARKSVRVSPGTSNAGGSPPPPSAAKRSTMVRGPQPPAGARGATSGRATQRAPRGTSSGGGTENNGSRIAAAGERPTRDFRVRRSGMSLSVKFMLIVSGMVAALMVLFFLTVFIITSKAVDDEINANGAAQSKALGNLCRVYIETIFNPQFMDALMRNEGVRSDLDTDYFARVREQMRRQRAVRSDFDLRHRVMDGFLLGSAHPRYNSVEEVLTDICRALIAVGGFIEPDKWDASPGSTAFFTPPADPARLLPDLRQWLTRQLSMDDLGSFRGDDAQRQIKQFNEMRDWAKQYLAAAEANLTDELRRAYHKLFLANYIAPLVNDANEIVGVTFTRLGDTGAAEVEQFAVPEGRKPLLDSSRTVFDVKVAEGPDLVQFGFTVRVPVDGGEGDEMKNLAYFAAVQFSAERVNGARNRLVMFLAAIALLAIVIGICVSYFMANSVTKPINTLVEDVIHIAQGEYEHRTRMKTQDEVGVLARTIDRMAEGLLEAREIAKERGKQQHELSIAEEVVIHLLPDSLPKIYGYDVYAFYNPSKEVGGDYYDFFEIDPNHVGMIVADVSGKGIPGAMVMTMARSVIRYEAMGTLSPRETFMRANRHIARDIKRGMFVTAFYVVLNTQTAEMTVASAGHNPLLLWRASTGKIEQINPNGIALGFDKGPIFDRTIKEDKVQLYSGDRVVLYTDGVVEAMSPDNEEYTDERFIELIESYPDANSNQLTNIIVQDVMDHQGGGEQSDDITIVTFKLL